MICKNCNAEISDGATACPFCGAPVTADVNPGMSGPVDLTKSSESQPAPQPESQTPPPADNQPYNQVPPPADNQPYNQVPPPAGNQVPPQYGNPSTPPPQYDQSYQGGGAVESEYDKQAKLPFTLGIVGLVSNGVGLLGFFCCCWYIPQLVAIIVGIIGMVKAKKMQNELYLVTPENQQKMKTGNTMCLVSLILGAVGIVLLTILMILGVAAGMSEEFANYLE